MRLTDRPLQVQFIFFGSVLSFLAILTVAMIFLTVKSQSEASLWLNRTHRAIAQLISLERAIEVQSDLLVEITEPKNQQKTKKLALLIEAQRTWKDGISVLESALLPSEISESSIKSLKELYEKWWIKAKRSLDKADHFFEEQRSIKMGLIRQLDQLLSVLNERLRERELKERQAMRFGIVSVTTSMVLLVLFTILLIRSLYKTIAIPIEELSAALSHFESGHHETRVSLTSRSEVGLLQKSYNRLAQTIQSQIEELKKLDDLKSEFLSTVSHELRTPLTSILGYTKLIFNEEAGPVTETQKEFLGIVRTNVERLNQLINDLLDVERLERKEIHMEELPQSLNQILKTSFELMAVMAVQKSLDYRYRVPDHLPEIRGDKAKLIQVFTNLLSNAIKYTPSGFVELSVTELPDEIKIQVSDSGLGMSEEEQKHLFQKFYRTKSAQSVPEGGTGLGLSIVKGIITAHRGAIAIQSKPNEGTVFTILIPKLKRRVLVAALDLEQTTKDELRRVLSQQSVVLNEVKTGSDVLKTLEDHQYDLILLGSEFSDMPIQVLKEAIELKFENIRVRIIDGTTSVEFILNEIEKNLNC